jgi:hypothetical protein
MPVQVTTDEAPGLISAVEETYPSSLRQQCLVDRTRDVTNKVHGSTQAQVKNAVQAVCYVPSREVAEIAAADVVKVYQSRFRAALRSFRDDWEACIGYLRGPGDPSPVPAAGQVQARPHHQPAGRLPRGRTSSNPNHPRFFTEKSGLKLVFAILWRAGQHRQRVRMSEIERQQLALIRCKLGLLADDNQDRVERKASRLAA